VSLQLTDAAKDLLVEEGYDPAMGARPLRRAIQRLLEDPLADELLHGTLTEGLVIVADRDGDKMKMERREAPPEAPAAPEAVAVGADSDAEGE
jgi:ATP-dependent Clp protease ATP-binding subunit ClpC